MGEAWEKGDVGENREGSSGGIFPLSFQYRK